MEHQRLGGIFAEHADDPHRLYDLRLQLLDFRFPAASGSLIWSGTASRQQEYREPVQGTNTALTKLLDGTLPPMVGRECRLFEVQRPGPFHGARDYSPAHGRAPDAASFDALVRGSELTR